MNIERYADLCTSHISPRDAELLDSRPGGLIIRDFDPGWMIYCHPNLAGEIADDIEHARAAGFSEEFCNILAAASTLGCVYVRFDPDGPEDPDLPTFEW